MALAQTLNTGDLVGSSEVVAVAIFAKPPLLAGHLAHLSARGHWAVMLAIFSPGIRNEELAANTVFTSSRRAAH